MNSIRNIIASAALAGLMSMNAVSTSQAGDGAWTMKPMNGVSFDIGAKRAVSYFLSDGGRCNLTLVVADQMQGDEVPVDTPVRFDVAIDGGKGARFDTAEGKSLQFDCAAGTQTMRVTEIQQLATSATWPSK
jgi:hypothetical protein